MSEHVQIKHDWRQLGELCAAVHKAETFDDIGAAIDGLHKMRVSSVALGADAHFTIAIDTAFDTASRRLRAFITDPAIIFKFVS